MIQDFLVIGAIIAYMMSVYHKRDTAMLYSLIVV